MKIAIATVQVPFVTGGAETLTELLRKELLKRGHEAVVISIPFKWYPSDTLIDCMIMGRMMDLTEVNGEEIELVIATKFPAYYVKHPNKVLWLMHQHRQAYDLWGTKYGDMHKWEDGEFVRQMIWENDNAFIKEAKRIYTISENSTARLERYNHIDAVTLYHPPKNHDRLTCQNFSNYIFYPSRIDRMKRQRLLVEAARFIKSDIQIYIAGKGSEQEVSFLESFIRKNGLDEKVKLLGFISEREKIQYYANCLAVYFGAYDEDYGYVTLEAFFSHKPVIVHHDAGGPLEFIEDGSNGFVIEANARAIAKTIDQRLSNHAIIREMGLSGYKSLVDKKIDWDYVISSLLGEKQV